MSVSEEDIKWAKDHRQMQLLYGVVNTSMAKNKTEADEQLTGKIKRFEDNLILLINLISGNDIPSYHITRFMIILINKTLLIADEAALANLTISSLHKNVKEIISCMITLHKLCQEEAFRTAMCKIQAKFITDCIINTEAPIDYLRQQLQLLQFNLSKNDSGPKYAESEESVQTIHTAIKSIADETQKVREFCEQYKVPFKKV